LNFALSLDSRRFDKFREAAQQEFSKDKSPGKKFAGCATGKDLESGAMAFAREL